MSVLQDQQTAGQHTSGLDLLYHRRADKVPHKDSEKNSI
jgi:hypothetical protein